MNLKNINTPATQAVVSDYLLARAFAETMRARVDVIQRAVLERLPIYADHDGRRIMTGGELYLCRDEATCRAFYDEADRQTRAAGLKPDSMNTDFCPALVAEHAQVRAEWALIHHAAPLVGLTFDRVNGSTLENRQKFIDLVVSLIVRAPGYRAPVIGGVS